MTSERIVQYQPANLAEPKELVNAIRQRRGGTLLNLDRMLLHSEPFAKGWNVFLKEVRENLDVDAQLRELAICLVAVINKADYEFLHHAPEFIHAGGTQEQVDMLRHWNTPSFDTHVFTPIQRQVMDLTATMTTTIQVPDSLMQSLQQTLGDSHLVELVGVIATYNMVSRFLIALRVTPES